LKLTVAETLWVSPESEPDAQPCMLKPPAALTANLWW
jgi:hypothetical protein